MNARATSRTLLVAALGIGVVAGSGITYLALAPHPASMPTASVVPVSTPAQAPTGAITLSADDIARAHIVLTTVEASALDQAVTIPGVVEPNAYKQTVVTALVAGRVTRVLAELGQHVRRGQALAELYSPELADAQRTYISAAATRDGSC
jgi:membrane fusion protein, heavy metal efflux system